MIDDEDFTESFLVLTDWIVGWKSLLFIAALLSVIGWATLKNGRDCSAQHCAHGKPRLTDRECLCVEATEPDAH